MTRKKWANRVTEERVASGEAQRIAFEESGPSSTAACPRERLVAYSKYCLF